MLIMVFEICICLLVLSVSMIIYGVVRFIYEYKVNW